MAKKENGKRTSMTYTVPIKDRIIEVTTRQIQCSRDHPVVYYRIGMTNQVQCDYCNITYAYKNKEEEYASAIP